MVNHWCIVYQYYLQDQQCQMALFFQQEHIHQNVKFTYQLHLKILIKPPTHLSEFLSP